MNHVSQKDILAPYNIYSLSNVPQKCTYKTFYIASILIRATKRNEHDAGIRIKLSAWGQSNSIFLLRHGANADWQMIYSFFTGYT